MHFNSNIIQNDTWTSSAGNIPETPQFLNSFASPPPVKPLKNETNEQESETRMEKIIDDNRQQEKERLTDDIKQYKVLLNKQKEINQKKIRDKSVQQLKFKIEDLKEDFDFFDRKMSRDISTSQNHRNGYSDGEQHQIFQTAQKENIETIQPAYTPVQQNNEPVSIIENGEEKNDVRPCSHQAKEVSFSYSSENTEYSPRRAVSTAGEVEPEDTTFYLSDTAIMAGGIWCIYHIVRQIMVARQYIQYQHQPAPQWLIVPDKKMKTRTLGEHKGNKNR